MTAADWGILIPAVVGVLGAAAAWLRAEAAHKRLNKLKRPVVSGLRNGPQ